MKTNGVHTAIGCAIIAAAMLLGADLTQAEPVERPNIVFIMADDLGYGQLGCYGQKHIRTPNIDRMAQEGTRFTQYYAGHCVCAPSRSTLMTGHHTGHTSVRANGGGAALLPEDITLAEVLKSAGYATGGFGKWGLGDAGTTGHPNRQGFDEFYGYLHQVHAHFYYPWFLWDNQEKHVLKENIGQKRRQYTHDLIADRALQFIRDHRQERFFLYVPFTIPHFELLVPEDSMTEYEGAFHDTRPYTGSHYASQPKPLTTLAAMITRMDRDVGRILDLLRELKIDKRTIVFFTSDNGCYLLGTSLFRNNGPLRGGKGSFYEGGIRVPMVVRWPGRAPAGKTDDLLWASWDILPTLAELAGGSAPARIDGVSFAKRLTGKQQTAPDRVLYWEKPLSQGNRSPWSIAARKGEWKLVRQKPRLPIELYNLRTDVGETRNVAAANPDVVREFGEWLKTARTVPRVYPPEEPSWSYPPLKTGYVK